MLVLRKKTNVPQKIKSDGNPKVRINRNRGASNNRIRRYETIEGAGSIFLPSVYFNDRMMRPPRASDIDHQI